DPLDLIVMDMEKVGKSPAAQLRETRAALAWSGLSAVLLVPEGFEGLERFLEDHEGSDYLVKPASVGAIADLVEATLKRRHLV
ncbi:MAG: hypothetical protein KDI19_16165, partial [Pseudomonadales bacterium]|nr:hypothetical protein [Pseudomonadales bacterium]